jgi:hypothetical protein
MFEGSPSPDSVETAPPRITLRNAFSHPFDSAIAAARTCYASRLITSDEITDKQRLNIGVVEIERHRRQRLRYVQIVFLFCPCRGGAAENQALRAALEYGGADVAKQLFPFDEPLEDFKEYM